MFAVQIDITNYIINSLNNSINNILIFYKLFKFNLNSLSSSPHNVTEIQQNTKHVL